MWILQSTGEFLNGKRVWLRPGKRYLFGRTDEPGVSHGSKSRSVSRKHMSIEVANVTPRDGTFAHARTKVTVTDLGSTKGTFVDGEKLSGERILDGTEHSIILAKAAYTLHLKWEPVVLSFSFSSREMKAEDPLAKVRGRLESLDIKTIVPYLVDQTTHVVQNKRNTAKGLQALINGKHIVKNSYLDAIEYATTPTDLESEAALSPLESDFDSAWPDPNEHLPPAGNEPTSRPAEAFAPNPDRINIFDKYTFVFGDMTQFDNLQAAITNGHGKALHYEVKDGETTAAEIVRFMKKAAGNQGVGNERVGKGGVVLVRFRSKGHYETWSIEVGNEVALMTDQRVIEQREFLDAILSNDAAPLCRPLPHEEGSSQVSITPAPEEPSPPSPPPVVRDEPSTSISPPAPSQPPTSRLKAGRERKYVSKMKTFDDGFDMDSIPAYESGPDETVDTQPIDFEPIEQSNPDQTMPTVEENEDADQDAVSDLLPGARAMKRRRAEMGDDQTMPAKRIKAESAPKPRRRKIDVLEEARKHREEEEKQQQIEKDSALSNEIDMEKLRDLAIVEEMELPVRQPPAREENTSDRWDDQWNGRKNFKRFRRKGEPRHARQRVQSVIVPLEEVTRKDFGIGEHYWSSNHKPSEQAPVVEVEEEEEEKEQLTTTTSQPSRNGRSVSRSQLSVPETSIPNQTPESQSTLARSRSQKRPRPVQDSESDDEPKFRFRRKR
ncbi:hypothetical protein N7481_008678 [Penicillium waksmanii]|uniref:uncharacterized protein n=1 Tax=Penicillium waksmanii TaxID=69791 RepID=UPI002547B995|nr:uncharacterized protein N7481_008678 [Penicillium waksmanii]KAJ5974971.1 hypothetical protein N7481_008678 [Penicillium waksmanii]